MAINFHLVRWRSLCQLSKNIVHIDSDFHTLSPVTFNKTAPRGIPCAHSKMTGLPRSPGFQSTSSFSLKGVLSYFFLTS